MDGNRTRLIHVEACSLNIYRLILKSSSCTSRHTWCTQLTIIISFITKHYYIMICKSVKLYIAQNIMKHKLILNNACMHVYTINLVTLFSISFYMYIQVYAVWVCCIGILVRNYDKLNGYMCMVTHTTGVKQ